MLQTRDGKNYKVGMWVENTAGVYEVTEIDDCHVYGREVCFDGEGDEYHLDTFEHCWSYAEARNMNAM